MTRWNWGSVLIGLHLMQPDLALAQQCLPTGLDQTCANAIFLSGGASGISDGATLTVTNAVSGVITGSGAGGSGVGINADAANVVNYGTIGGAGAAGMGIMVATTANVINRGAISGVGTTGTGWGILAFDTANVVNYGSITGFSPGFIGLGINAITAYVVNYGLISGNSATGTGYGIMAGAANVANAGIISGSTGAFQFFFNPDVLTLLPGSRIVGAALLGGGGDIVNFRGGNHNLTFDTLVGATIAGTTPFAVSGNRAAAVDLTPFAASWRSLTDFTRAAADAVPVFSGIVPGGGVPVAFAGSDGFSRVESAFASIPGLSAYSSEAMAFKAPTASYADGTTIWARGFAGQRIQQQDGVLLRTVNLFYGGMIGGDWQTRPDLRLGFFLGGGKTRTSIDFNQGDGESNLLFGGAFTRHDIGPSFLHATMQAGTSRNATARTINNNLMANGLEVATASYDGWYVNPEATIGHRLALGKTADASYTLTPSLRLRYLYGSYGGYTETGSTANLAVGRRSVSTLEERGELKLTRTMTFAPADMLSVSISGGVLGTQRLGAGMIDAAMLGQPIPFVTPGKPEVWGAFGGLGFEWRMRNVAIFSTAEYLALFSNASIVNGRAGLRVSF